MPGALPGVSAASTGPGGLAAAFGAPAPVINTQPAAAPVAPTALTPDKGQIPYLPLKTPPATGPGIVSTGDIHQQGAMNSNKLAVALANLGTNSDQTNNPETGADSATSDPILAGLKSLQSTNDAATKSLIASTAASYQNKMNAVNKQYANYQAGLQQMGIESNSAQSSPELLAGHIQQAASDRMQKVNDLSAEEAKAIMDAKTAQANNDFKALDDSMTRLQQIQTDKATAIKDMYDGITSAKTASDDEAASIYSTMQTLDPSDQEAYIQAVASKYNLPLDGLVGSLANYAATQKKNDLDTENIESEIANRNSGGTAATKPIAGTGGLTQSQLDQGDTILQTGKDANGNAIGNAKGSDGFVDPSVYLKLYNSWKGSNDAFLKAYPVNQVNPDSYDLLPTALQPSASSGNTP